MWRTWEVVVLILVMWGTLALQLYACEPATEPPACACDAETWAKVQECMTFAGREELLNPSPACRACVLEANCGILAAKGACVEECSP